MRKLSRLSQERKLRRTADHDKAILFRGPPKWLWVLAVQTSEVDRRDLVLGSLIDDEAKPRVPGIGVSAAQLIVTGGIERLLPWRRPGDCDEVFARGGCKKPGARE
jgi:hypothetical protein